MAFSPTHKAIVINGVPLDVFPSEDSLENPIRQAMDVNGDGEEFEMVQPHVGADFAYAKVKDSTGATVVVQMMGLVVINSDNIEQFQVGMPNLLDKFAIPGLQVDGSNLENADLNIPFQSDDNYSVVIDTRTTRRATFKSMKDEYKKKAVKLIAEYYGKDISVEAANEYAIKPVNRVKVGKPYFPLRPGQNIRAVVSLPRALFDSLPDITFDKFAVKELHTNWLAISLEAASFTRDVDTLTKILENYNGSVVRFSGTVLNLNFGDLALKLRRFASEFNNMLIANDISIGNLTPDAKFEFGFNSETYSLRYILVYDPYGEFLRVRMNVLSANMDIKIAKLLISRKEIINAAAAGMGWMDFLSEFFAGDYEIKFTNIGAMANSSRSGMTDLEADFNLKKQRFDDISFNSPIDQLEFNKLTMDDSFKRVASMLLLNARNRVGDNLLISLPNIVSNVNDLGSLYTLIFDKISIKDLVDILTKAVTAELSLPDFNEIKIRGIVKKLNFDMSTEIMFDTLDIGQFQGFMSKLCELYKLQSDTIDNLLEDLPLGEYPILYLLSMDEDGNLQGLISDTYIGDLREKLKSLDVDLDGDYPCVSFALKIADGTLSFKDFYQPASAASILCELLTTGLPRVDNMCTLLSPGNLSQLPRLNIDEVQRRDGTAGQVLSNDPMQLPSISLEDIKMPIFKALKRMDKELVKKSMQEFIKDLFEADPGIYFKFLKVPKIKMEVDKLALTKEGLLKEVPGLGISTEYKKSDVSFQLPKIKDVNPSFDFTKFLMPTFDIFQIAIKAIEIAIIKGIEMALVGMFKAILKNIVKALKSDASDFRAPDFGGLSLPDLLDATDGFSMDNFADLAVPMINARASTASGDALILPSKGSGVPNSMTPADFDFTSFPDPPVGTVPLDFQYSGFSESGGDGSSSSAGDGVASADELREALEDMSAALKPLELLQIAKGDFDREDYKIMVDSIKNSKMKSLLTEDIFNDMMRIIADYADMHMLNDLERMHGNREIITALCDTAGIDYGDAPGELGSLRDALINKFPDLPLMSDGLGTGDGTGTDDDDDLDDPIDSIDKIINDAVNEAKEGLIDAIGSMKDDFNESLPFNEDPCSFMPKAADIPALDFANNMVFDSTFDSVKKQYKKEATTFPDMMISSKDPESFIPLYYMEGDEVPIDYSVDSETGMFTIVYTTVTEDHVLNREFSDHYHGDNTPIYAYDIKLKEFIEGETLNEGITKNRHGDCEWKGQNSVLSFLNWGSNDSLEDTLGEAYLPNVYVRNTQPELAPIPEVKEFLENIQFHYTLQYTSSVGEPGDALYGVGHYQVNLPNDNLSLIFDEHGNVYTEFPSYQADNPEPECVSTSLDTFSPDTQVDAIGLFQEGVRTLLLRDFTSMIPNGHYQHMDLESIVDIKGEMYGMGFSRAPDEELYRAHRDVICEAVPADYEVRRFGEKVEIDTDNPVAMENNPFIQQEQEALNYALLPGYEWKVNYHLGDTKSSYHRMTKLMFDKLSRQFSKSKYFNISDMQTFIFDSDEIDLLKSDEAKAAAKDEFNEKCTFREEDRDKLRDTAVKKLLALTMRLYMIEMVVRGCFVFGHVLPKEGGMNEALFKFFFNSMVNDLKEVSSTYFTTFKESFKKEYGFSLLQSEEPLVANHKVRELCANMFNDIMVEARKVFPEAKETFYQLFFSDADLGTTSEVLELYTDTTIDLPNRVHEILTHIKRSVKYNDDIKKMPFMIQRLYIVENDQGNIIRSFLYDDYEGVQYRLYGSVGPRQGTSPFRNYANEPKLVYRLCYVDYAHTSIVKNIEQDELKDGMNYREFAYFLNATPGDYGEKFDFPVEVVEDSIYRNPEGWSRKYYQSNWTNLHNINIDGDLQMVPILDQEEEARDWSSYDYNHRYGRVMIPKRNNHATDSRGFLQCGIMRAYRAHVVVLPVEQVSSDQVSGWEEAKKYFWEHFFAKKLNMDKYYVLFLLGIISKTAIAKPDVKHAFAESKLVLKRAIEALSLPQETFNHVDEDNENLDDMSEISTTPDNSNVSKKLSAGTANLMLKGDAEKFDPNIREAKKIRDLARKYGINMTPTLSSQLARPWNYMPRKNQLSEQFDKGRPILRLGRKYLKSGYLEPKERKEIADIKSGKNTNVMLLGEPDYTLQAVSVDPSYSATAGSRHELLIAKDYVDRTTEFLSDLYDAYLSLFRKLDNKTFLHQADGGNGVPYSADTTATVGGDTWFPGYGNGIDTFPSNNDWRQEYQSGTAVVGMPETYSDYNPGNIMMELNHSNLPPGIANLVSAAKDYYCDRGAGDTHTHLNFEGVDHPDPSRRHLWNMRDYLKALNWMHQTFWYGCRSNSGAWKHYGGTTSFASTLRVTLECLAISAANYGSDDDHDERFDKFLLMQEYKTSRVMVIDLWCFWKTFVRLSNATYIKICKLINHPISSIEDGWESAKAQYSPALSNPHCPSTDHLWDSMSELADDIYQEEYDRIGLNDFKVWARAEMQATNTEESDSAVGHLLKSYIKGELSERSVYFQDNPNSTMVEGGLNQLAIEMKSIQKIIADTSACGLADLFCLDPSGDFDLDSNPDYGDMVMNWDGILSYWWGIKEAWEDKQEQDVYTTPLISPSEEQEEEGEELDLVLADTGVLGEEESDLDSVNAAAGAIVEFFVGDNLGSEESAEDNEGHVWDPFGADRETIWQYYKRRYERQRDNGRAKWLAHATAAAETLSQFRPMGMTAVIVAQLVEMLFDSGWND